MNEEAIFYKIYTKDVVLVMKNSYCRIVCIGMTFR